VLGALPDQFVNAIQHRSFAYIAEAPDCRVREETPNQPILTEHARFVQVAEEVFHRLIKGNVRIHVTQSLEVPKEESSLYQVLQVRWPSS
jgi:hypothetical protein